jgi:uncharacterized protein (TIGR00369 family)
MGGPQLDLIERLDAVLAEVAAPFVAQLGLKVVAASANEVTLAMPVTPTLVHAGGVLCGQAMMAAADTAMILVVSASLGGFKPMTTVQLQTSFLKPVPGNTTEVRVVCTLLRRGRNLAFGEIRLLTPHGQLAAHATCTYAIL